MNLNNSKNNLDEKLLMWLMIVTPFVDLLNGFFEFELNTNISPGVIIRTFILIIIMSIYIQVEKSNLLKILFILSMLLIQILVLNFIRKIDLFSEISFISKIYYNIFLIAIAGRLCSRKNIKYDIYIDTLAKVCVVVTVSLILTRILGVGVNSYGDAGGYKGLYMGTNDLTAVLIMTFPFMLYRLIKGQKQFFYAIIVLLSGLNIIMIGTKATILFLIIITLFFAYNMFFKEISIKGIVIMFIFIIGFIFLFKIYLWDIFKSTIIERQIYFLKQNDIISYLLSGRNTTMIKSIEYWKSNLFYIVFGTGFTMGSEFIGTFLPGHGMIEMDLFDILYFYGIILFIIVGLPLISCLFKGIKVLLKSKELKYKLIALVYIVVFLISFLSGHVLLSPLAGVYFAVIYGMLKNI